MPVGGGTGQVLTKVSAADYNSNWQTPATGLALPLAQTLTFNPDNAFDIGATAASRPRDLFLGRNATIAGTLTLSADPTLALQAATKQYADTKLTQAAADARYPLKTDPDPYPTYLTQTEGDARYQTPAQSAALYLPLAGGTLAGNLLFSTDNTRDIGASGATRPRDFFLGRNALVGGTLGVTGATTLGTLSAGATTMTSTLLLAADPTLALQAATKQYADTKLTQTLADARYLQLAGGTLTGLLTLSADPSTALQAATKQYADTKITQAQGDARYQTPAQAAALYLPLAGGTLAGNLLFSTDNTRDIGASGATRPRDLFLGRNLATGSNAGIGVAPAAQKMLTVQGTLSTLTTGILSQPTFGSDSAGLTGFGVDASLVTAAASFTLGTYAAYRANAPFLGAGSSLTTAYGLQVANQGKAGITNAYGVHIAAQSGAATLNVGLRNLSTSLLEGQVSIGADATLANRPYLRMMPNQSQAVSLESPASYAAVAGKGATLLGGNAYLDGVQWYRFNVGDPATAISVNPDLISFQLAPAGPNPISFSEVGRFTSGGLAVTGTLATTGTLGLAGRSPAPAATVSVPNTNGAATFDNSGGSGQAGQAIANNGYWEPLGSSMNFSGMLLLNETILIGCLAIILCGAGSTSIAGNHPAATPRFSSAQGTAGKINVYYGPSAQILVENLSGGTINLSCMAFRTRYSA